MVKSGPAIGVFRVKRGTELTNAGIRSQFPSNFPLVGFLSAWPQ
jgi:hypothetical protein